MSSLGMILLGIYIYMTLGIELANRQENFYLGTNLLHLNLPEQLNCHINLLDMGVCELIAVLWKLKLSTVNFEISFFLIIQ